MMTEFLPTVLTAGSIRRRFLKRESTMTDMPSTFDRWVRPKSIFSSFFMRKSTMPDFFTRHSIVGSVHGIILDGVSS